VAGVFLDGEKTMRNHLGHLHGPHIVMRKTVCFFAVVRNGYHYRGFPEILFELVLVALFPVLFFSLRCHKLLDPEGRILCSLIADVAILEMFRC